MMIEKEQITTSAEAPEIVESPKKPGLLITGFVFSMLGLVTPFLVYLAYLVIIPTPRAGENHTPGDGLGVMLIGMFGILWWTLTALLSLVFTVSGFARGERGGIRIPAVATTVLSLILIVSVYIGAYAFYVHVTRQVERDRQVRKL